MPVSVQAVSRRRFLKISMGLGAAAALPRGVFATAAPLAPDRIALLSDVHVSGGLNGIMSKRLTVAVDQVLGLSRRPHKVLIAGDCAYLRGKACDYEEYLRRIEPLVAADLPMHMTMGNHDHRERFWEALPADSAGADIALQRQAMVVPARHANWFLLDSLNSHDRGRGELGSDQLEWLAAELDARADKPALIMLHHPPAHDGDRGSLHDSDDLLAITRPRRHVKALFFGHTHVWQVLQDRSGMHLVNLPATGYTLFLRSFIGWVECHVHASGATLRTHALKTNEKEDGQIVRLRWRSA